MRLLAMAGLLTIFAALALALEPEKHPAGILPPGRNHDWLKFLAERDKTMTRVTERPLNTKFPGQFICSGLSEDQSRAFNPHRDYFIHVYVTKNEEQKIRTGEGTFPVGTLIVKEKFPKPEPPPLVVDFTKPGPSLATDQTNTLPPLEVDFTRNVTDEKLVGFSKASDQPYKPELFTAMLKREAGYNPDCGDWEFMVISGDAKAMIARGKIDSCIDCHKGRNRNDYVTQKYPKPK